LAKEALIMKMNYYKTEGRVRVHGFVKLKWYKFFMCGIVGKINWSGGAAVERGFLERR